MNSGSSFRSHHVSTARVPVVLSQVVEWGSMKEIGAGAEANDKSTEYHDHWPIHADVDEWLIEDSTTATTTTTSVQALPSMELSADETSLATSRRRRMQSTSATASNTYYTVMVVSLTFWYTHIYLHLVCQESFDHYPLMGICSTLQATGQRISCVFGPNRCSWGFLLRGRMLEARRACVPSF